tara:strand:- start:13063 stop:13449 length:387 start_codon:yes stop_codon:yes gene_type:complete
MKRMIVAFMLSTAPAYSQTNLETGLVVERAPLMCQAIGREAFEVTDELARDLIGRRLNQQYADTSHREGNEQQAEAYLQDHDRADAEATEHFAELSTLFSLAVNMGCDMESITDRSEEAYRSRLPLLQ